MHPAPAVHHLDSPFVNFRDFDFGAGSHGYRWINTKRFGLPTHAPDAEDRTLLAALIAHSQFRDTYDGAGGHTALAGKPPISRANNASGQYN